MVFAVMIWHATDCSNRCPGHPYHVMQRGNSRQAIFRNDEDRAHYLSWVNAYSRKFHLSVWAYCFMDHHVHFIVQPREEESLAKEYFPILK